VCARSVDIYLHRFSFSFRLSLDLVLAYIHDPAQLYAACTRLAFVGDDALATLLRALPSLRVASLGPLNASQVRTEAFASIFFFFLFFFVFFLLSICLLKALEVMSCCPRLRCASTPAHARPHCLRLTTHTHTAAWT
jgi:hypothetical protein